MSGVGTGKTSRSGYTCNNTARLLRSGPEFFDALVKLIDESVHEIHFQTYIFEEDETGERVLQALIRAAGRGVKIFLLLDAYGSNHLTEKFSSQIKNSNIEFRWFGPLFRKGRFHIGRRLHRKVVVADRLTALVSGINISNHYNDMPQQRAWLDFGVQVKGEVSEKLYLICRQSWLKIRFKRWSAKHELNPILLPEENSSSVKIRVRQNDWKIGKKQATIHYHQLIRQAGESLIIVGGYFLPGLKARRLLRKASARGVVIKLIIARRSDVGVMRNAMLYLYDWLLRYKIRIYEYQPSNVHGKAIIADKRKVSVGSYDLNSLSNYSNIELNLDIENEQFAANFHRQLEQVIENDCVEINEDNFRKQSGIGQRLLRWFSYRTVKSLFLVSVKLAQKESDETYQ